MLSDETLLSCPIGPPARAIERLSAFVKSERSAPLTGDVMHGLAMAIEMLEEFKSPQKFIMLASSSDLLDFEEDGQLTGGLPYGCGAGFVDTSTLGQALQEVRPASNAPDA